MGHTSFNIDLIETKIELDLSFDTTSTSFKSYAAEN
jgi:hypothetical protein